MDADYFRGKALRCRLLLTTERRPEVRQQLHLWAQEFEDIADANEAEAHEREDTEQSLA